jgi:hypothetical protein
VGADDGLELPEALETTDVGLPDRLLPDSLRRRVVIAGVELEREFTRVLPSGFVTAYLALHLKALGISQSSGASDVGVAQAKASGPRTSTSQTETRGGAKPGKKLAGAAGKQVIKNAAALAHKAKVDRKLRSITREVWVWMREDTTARSSVRRCTRCKKYGEDTWSFCPYDGQAMEEVD